LNKRCSGSGFVAALGMVAALATQAADQPTTGANATSNKQVTPTLPYDWFFNSPDWLTWLSLAGAVGAFGWRLVEFGTSRRDRTTDLQIATEAYWYDAIVIDQVLKPLLAFIETQSTAVAAIPAAVTVGPGNSDPYLAYQTKYQKDYNTLAARLLLLRVVSVSAHADLMTRLDELEDTVATICDEGSARAHGALSSRKRSRPLPEELSDGLIACVGILIALHASMHSAG
jgi:hypothetical protein